MPQPRMARMMENCNKIIDSDAEEAAGAIRATINPDPR